MPSILSVVADFRTRRLANDKYASQQLIDAYAGVHERLQLQIHALNEQILGRQQDGRPVTRATLKRLERYQELRQQVLREMAQLSNLSEQLIIGSQGYMIDLGPEMARAVVEAQLAAQGTGVWAQWNRLPRGAFNDLVGALSDGSPLRSLIDELPAATASELEEKLLQQVALGWNPRKTAEMLDGAVKLSQTRALTILRTEGTRAFAGSAIETYGANSDILRGWERLCARSTRTCACCWALDGTFYPLSARFDEHPNGRCTPVPVLIGQEQAIQGRKKGPEAFADLGEDDKKRILRTKSGYEAYKRGEAQLRDFVQFRESERWGTTATVRPVSKILRRAA